LQRAKTVSDVAIPAAGAVRFRVNGTEQRQDLVGAADVRLIDLMRERFGLMAAKLSCSIGRCGSCLMLVDGKVVNGCLMMAWQLDGADVVTPEGLAALPEGRAVLSALTAEVSFQCGYCAPGFSIALTALLLRDPDADEAAIRAGLSGNLCRCTGYASILRGAALARIELARQRAAAAT
jgi:carbon-monoxide dehydrogenase small subunit